MRRRAFTLIELLIVIAIIGLLATFAMLGLSNARAKGRDTKRLADLSQIQKALALGQGATNGNYPTDASIVLGQTGSSTVLCLNGAAVKFQGNQSGCVANNIYMGLVPNDPLPSQSYVYKYYSDYNGTGPGFCIQTTIEGSVTNPNLVAGPIMTDPTGTQNGTCP